MKLKRLFLIYHGRFPSEKAASLFAAKDAESFADHGIEVILMSPRISGIDGQDAYSFYGIKNNFKIREIAGINFFNSWLPKPISFYLSMIYFSVSLYFHLRKEKITDNDLLYSNEILPLFFASSLTNNIFYEMHDFPESKIALFRAMLRKVRWILIHNRWKAEKAVGLFPFLASRIIIEPNAVDLKEFDIGDSKESARKRLGLPLEKKIIMYTGHLFGWKGVYTLGEAAKEFPEDFLTVFVGGTKEDVLRFRTSYNSRSVMITGFRPHKEIPVWQKAADILVIPNSGLKKISTHYTSPMKLFEYMASKRPIIASEIPSIQEIVSSREVVFVKPDDPIDLLDKIVEVIESPIKQEEMVSNAFKNVSERTWEKRAERIISFINKND